MFGMRNYDGLCVFVCRHPEVVEYITTTMGSVHEWMGKDQVEGVTFVIFSTSTRKLIAKYVYDIDILVDNLNPEINEFDLASLDSQLRAHVSRLMATGTHIPFQMSQLSRVQSANPSLLEHNNSDDETSFDVLVHTTGTNHRHFVDWVPANNREVWAAACPIATPIKDADPTCGTAAICARVEIDVEDEKPDT